jgi:hypothetical protein
MSLTFSFDVCNYTYVQITCLKGKFYKWQLLSIGWEMWDSQRKCPTGTQSETLNSFTRMLIAFQPLTYFSFWIASALETSAIWPNPWHKKRGGPSLCHNPGWLRLPLGLNKRLQWLQQIKEDLTAVAAALQHNFYMQVTLVFKWEDAVRKIGSFRLKIIGW